MNLIKVSSPTVPTGKSSSDTKRRRSNEISKIRHQLSLGDVTSQFNNEIKMLPSEEREKIMKEANFSVTVPPEEGLAMKADLCMPWRKLRLMRRYLHVSIILLGDIFYNNVLYRWMKSWGANMASEGKQRALMKNLLSELIVRGESVPFSFSLKGGGHELRPAPLAFVDNLKAMLFHLLEEKQRLDKSFFSNDYTLY